ncbi:unnamed protein product [Fraxinus pennsylvanica]|uniref:ATPase AAA-type core domain-containing protein n=1 Tax=Fraxinus pennsylvanica TaxID=56036 RepID=A0AAD1ZAL2_9LAMI|nr:unnamed protein product [Fraxinus pennsylvanica]
MARSKKACVVFFDEVDAIGGAQFDDGMGGDNEVQRTMLEIVNQLDGFDACGNIKVLIATNRFSWTVSVIHSLFNFGLFVVPFDLIFFHQLQLVTKLAVVQRRVIDIIYFYK